MLAYIDNFYLLALSSCHGSHGVPDEEGQIGRRDGVH